MSCLCVVCVCREVDMGMTYGELSVCGLCCEVDMGMTYGELSVWFVCVMRRTWE